MLLPSASLVRPSVAIASAGDTETLYHVTLLSNFVQAYDKYSRIYSKAKLARSTFPDKFFLLRASELPAGIHKAKGLLERHGRPGDRCIVLVSKVSTESLYENTQTGIGRFILGGALAIAGVAWLEAERLIPIAVEEASAEGFRIGSETMQSYESLKPRSFSVLPIAQGCQASCAFCFSSASISSEQKQSSLDLGRMQRLASRAKEAGASRFVITGGGEPGLLKHKRLCDLIAAGSSILGKSILITNGYHLARASKEQREKMLLDYHQAGLRVLSISRHHHDDSKNDEVMKLQTGTRAVIESWRSLRDHLPHLQLRLIAVLQRGALDSLAEIENYLGWAAEQGVGEICFKELYVSTSTESVYHRYASNQWSRAHQVSLEVVLRFADKHGFAQVDSLPWGAPIFRGEWKGVTMQIAAYTEPSLFWERTQGVARSWNQLADGRCFASLEDQASELI